MPRQVEDEGMHVRFYRYPVDGRIHCSMQQSGDKSTIIDEFVEETEYDRWKLRFPEEWRKFNSGVSQIPEEQSLDYCPWIDYGMRMEFNHAGIHTLPQLAKISDAGIEQIGVPGLRPLIRRAQKEVEDYDRKKALEASESKAARKNAELEAEMAEMKKTIAELTAAKTARKPGLSPPVKRAKA